MMGATGPWEMLDEIAWLRSPYRRRPHQPWRQRTGAIPVAADPHAGDDPARWSARHFGTTGRTRPTGGTWLDDRDREPDRRQRQCRHDGSRQGAARRLYADHAG